MNERFKVMGVIPSEHKDDNSDFSPEGQKISKLVPIYTTDDLKEAATILESGGFIRDAQWYAASEVIDTQTGERIS